MWINVAPHMGGGFFVRLVRRLRGNQSTEMNYR
jgi:hypothetical protein